MPSTPYPRTERTPTVTVMVDLVTLSAAHVAGWDAFTKYFGEPESETVAHDRAAVELIVDAAAPVIERHAFRVLADKLRRAKNGPTNTYELAEFIDEYVKTL